MLVKGAPDHFHFLFDEISPLHTVEDSFNQSCIYDVEA